MGGSIGTFTRIQNEHAKDETGFDIYCLPHKPKRLGWERRHYFKAEGLGQKAKKAVAAKTLMIKVTGKRYIYQWEEPRTLYNIITKPLDEAFKVKADGTTNDDNHGEGTHRVPPFCGWWGYGKFDLSLVEAKFTDDAKAKKRGGASQKSNEAPEFAHDNRDGDFQGLEGYPRFEDLKMDPIEEEGDVGGSYKGSFAYAYLPMHCGDLTIQQVLANPSLKAELVKQLKDFAADGGAPRSLDQLAKVREETLKQAIVGAGIAVVGPVGMASVVGTGGLAAMTSRIWSGGDISSGASVASVGWTRAMFPVRQNMISDVAGPIAPEGEGH